MHSPHASHQILATTQAQSLHAVLCFIFLGVQLIFAGLTGSGRLVAFVAILYGPILIASLLLNAVVRSCVASGYTHG